MRSASRVSNTPSEQQLIYTAAAVMLAVIAFTVTPLQAQVLVNCDEGDTIQGALDAQLGAPLAEIMSK